MIGRMQIINSLSRHGPAKRAALILVLSSACGLALCAPDALAQSLQVQPAQNGQATRPLPITASGDVQVPSTIAIYAGIGGSACGGQASDEAGRGATLIDQRAISVGTFAYTVNFTPASAGTYSICTYLDGAASGMTEHQNQASSISVAAAPTAATPPAQTSPPPTVAPLGRTCVVPGLRRHTLLGAEHRLAVAGCKIGRIYRPSARSLRTARRRAGGRPTTLVVVSQTPAPGTIRIAGYTVAVRLGFGRAPVSATPRRRL